MKSILLIALSVTFAFILIQSHPMAFSLFLLLLSLVVSVFLAFSSTVWLGLGLALIFMGGMMIIILYVSALVGESKFFSATPALPLIFLLPCLLLAPNLSTASVSQMNLSLFSFFLSFTSFMLVFLTLYLLLTLVLVVVISEAHNGPITQWN